MTTTDELNDLNKSDESLDNSISPENTKKTDAEKIVLKIPEKESEEENSVAIIKSEDESIVEDIVDEQDEPEDDDEVIDYDILSREELIETIEKAVNTKYIEKVKRRIGLIKLAFIKLTKEEKERKLNEFIAIEGNKKQDYKPEVDELEVKFNDVFKVYKKKKKDFEDAVNSERNENLEKKKQILEDIKKLIESGEELKHTYDSFRKLQNNWKETGQVPPSETSNLWRSYHFLVEKFLDKVRMNEELRDLDKKKNLEQCIDLCEKAEELMLNPSINDSYRLLQKYHDEWKEIGSLPPDKKEEVWERFRQASLKVNERRREHFEKIKIQHNNNLAAKTALCENIEELVKINYKNHKEWQEATDKVIEIQNFWRKIGRVPDEDKDEIWKRFRTAIDLFFENKKEHFEGIKEEYVNNYNLKLDICNQAEALKTSNDWKNTTNALIKLQNDWKKIGHLPKKQSDELWKKFRAACDCFFERKQEYFSHIDEKEKENLNAKLELIEKVKNHKIEGDNKQVLEIIKEYQREFTAIGFVPNEERERVNNLFRDAINFKFDEMKINPVEKKLMGYKSKFEPLKKDSRSAEVIKNEIRFITNKITQLNSDIQLWENNIGFFAKSKNADVFKQEFESKIEKAKEELKLLEEKLKFLKAK